MLYSSRCLILCALAAFIVAAIGQEACEDYVTDSESCTKFIRCFANIRVRFTCPSGTAWDESLKTCLWTEQVEDCQRARQQRKIDTTNGPIIYDADVNALNNTPVGRTVAEARALGPIVTPRQYQCSYCGVGACGIVINTIQCYCGNIQCQTTTLTTVQPRNPCAPNPCLNGGQCVPSGQGFVCNCPQAYTGNRCEAPAPNPCQPNPCLNGGICIPQGTNSFLCQCPSNFYGYCCENRLTTTTPYNPCLQNPCQNGGICVPQGASFNCRCPTNFYGYCCENRVTTTTPYNPCAPNPCQNGAQCIPAGNVYLCQCPSGFYGARCESRNYCMPNPCANNGLCTQTTTGYICACSYPYTGTNCQQIISTTPATTIATRAPCTGGCACIYIPCPTVVVTNPCSPNPCQNMGGCAVQNNGARCWCPDNYQGYYCQYRRSARSLTSRSCNETCLNGGQCYTDDLHGGQARCSCPNEYYGARCEFMNRPKSCSPTNPCMNDGQCVTTGAGAQCVCQKGTSGVLCERLERSIHANTCPLDCQAGGTCVHVGSTAKCHCPQDRTGRFCETQSTD